MLDATGASVVYVPTPRFFSTSLRLGMLGGRSVFNPVAVAADCLLLAWAALAYARATRRARAQVVHTGSIFAHLLGVLAAPLGGARLVWHVQDIVSPRLGSGRVLPFFTWLGARRAALVVCPSEAVAANLRAHWPAAVPQDRLRVVHNGIDLCGYEPGLGDDGLPALDLPPDAFVVIHVGRLVPWKGQREFLRAAQIVARQCPAARFVIVGDVAFEGPGYREELHRLARDLGLAERVIFTGWRRDVPALLSAADVLVHSSILPEPFGLVLVEAMALERPVVASALGGPGAIVRDGRDGLLVDPRRPQEIAAAVLRLAGDPALRRAMGRSGRARALACFGAERFSAGLVHVLQEAAGRRATVEGERQ
jgi:glycosyltransferase involved in cell wall biosynthesis